MNSKFNIKPHNCKYFINKDKRTIVCVINDTTDAFIDYAEKHFILNANCDEYSSIYHKSMLDSLEMPNRFVGIAVCSPDDEWDEELGKLIAYNRAADKLNNSFFKRANTYVHLIDKYANQAVEILNQLGSKLAQETDQRHATILERVGQTE